MRQVRRWLVVLLLLAIALWAGWTYELGRPVYESGQPLTLVVEPGMSVHGIGEQLQQMGLVRHPALFRAVVMARGVAGQLRRANTRSAGASRWRTSSISWPAATWCGGW
jgi:cell division protein YceG involved in septum cleavage